MKNNDRWRLPDGVEELLPEAAARLEQLRRQLTDLHFQWGFELVIPPLIEYLDSLLTGSGEMMDLQTFKLIDQLGGKMMGVRADMTPQVARIDANLLNSDDVTRLFYMGSVLRTLPDVPGGSRSPLQLGAEIYGHADVDSDIEIIELMLCCIKTAGVSRPFLDLGHVGVFRGLAQQAGLDAEQESVINDALQRKSQPDIAEFLASIEIDAAQREMLSNLAHLHGGVEVLNDAREVLALGGPTVAAALNTVTQIAETLISRDSTVGIHVDLSELRGYSYHTGVVFSAYDDEHGNEVARGGRYDDIGAAFGRTRHATGYSADLKELSRMSNGGQQSMSRRGIFVSDSSHSDAWVEINRLREQGERVVTRLSGSNLTAESVGCDRQLVNNNNMWQVETV